MALAKLTSLDRAKLSKNCYIVRKMAHMVKEQDSIQIDNLRIKSIEDIAALGSITVNRYFTEEEFQQLSDHFEDLQFERESDGKLTIMSPVKGGSGKREFRAITYLGIWLLETGLGEAYSSATGIQLPDGSIKSPDAAWVSPERLQDLTPEQEENEYLPVVPDFIIEVRSQTDRLQNLQEKMAAVWLKNGVRLAWLIDPYEEKAYIYQAGKDVEIVENFDDKLSGGEIMPGFQLPLKELKISK